MKNKKAPKKKPQMTRATVRVRPRTWTAVEELTRISCKRLDVPVESMDVAGTLIELGLRSIAEHLSIPTSPSRPDVVRALMGI